MGMIVINTGTPMIYYPSSILTMEVKINMTQEQYDALATLPIRFDRTDVPYHEQSRLVHEFTKSDEWRSISSQYDDKKNFWLSSIYITTESSLKDICLYSDPAHNISIFSIYRLLIRGLHEHVTDPLFIHGVELGNNIADLDMIVSSMSLASDTSDMSYMHALCTKDSYTDLDLTNDELRHLFRFPYEEGDWYGRH